MLIQVSIVLFIITVIDLCPAYKELPIFNDLFHN